MAHEMATSNPPFKPISTFFGLWHEHRRGAHRGMHRFYFRDKLILLLNTKFFSKKMGSYASLKPKNAVIISPQAFNARKLSSLSSNIELDIVKVAATAPGMDCNKVSAMLISRCHSQSHAWLRYVRVNHWLAMMRGSNL